MRKKIVLATAAGALAVGGLALAAVPAVADDDTATTGSASPVEDRVRDHLSDLVDDGSITQEQADEVATTLDEAAADGWPGWGGGWGGWHGAWADGFAEIAETLGLSEDELRTALEADGATLASVAEAQGVAVEDLVATIVASAREHIATAVEDGWLTQEQADERLADLETRVTEAVQSTDVDGPWNGPWDGHHGGHHWGWGPDGD